MIMAATASCASEPLQGQIIRLHHLNELTACALSAALVPNTKEPQGLCRSDGKRPDGLTLVPCQSGKPLIWDATIGGLLCSLGGPVTVLHRRWRHQIMPSMLGSHQIAISSRLRWSSLALRMSQLFTSLRLLERK